MKKIRLSRADQQEITRRRLLAAAEIIICRVGYSGSSTDLIAAEAGYSRGAVYSNFPSKQALFAEVLAIHMQSMVEELKKLLDSPPQQLLTLLQSWLEATYLNNDRSYVMIELQLHAHRDSEFREQYVLLQKKLNLALQQVIMTYVEATSAAPTPDYRMFAEALTALSQGLILQYPMGTHPHKDDKASTIQALFGNLGRIFGI